MKFGNLHFLWILWIIPIIIFFYSLSAKKNLKLIRDFVSDKLRDRLLENFSWKRRNLKIVFTLVAFILMALALIRPKWGFHWEEVKRRGVDIMIALDVSKSMLAEDVSPNRLERAKREIMDLLQIVEGDRIGLIAFSGTSFVQAPLTLDYGAIHIFLDDIDTEFIPVPGTAIGEAIEQSTGAFDTKSKKSKVLILITDGEDHFGQPIEAAQKAAKEGIKIYTIGMGQKGGAPIPDKKEGGFKKDRHGELILTKLDENSLQKIALETGGSYVRSVTGDLDLEKIYGDIRRNVEDKDLQSGKRKRFEERYQWPLFLAFFLLFFGPLISERKRKRQSTKLILLLLFCMDSAHGGFFSSPGHNGMSQYESENYDEALKNLLDAQIESPDDINLKYNLANTYYKLGQFEEAEKLFRALAVEGEKALAQRSHYNLGNTLYRMGKLKDAVAHYERALELDPGDEDAKFNLNYVREEIKKRIEEQKKRQQNQKQEQEQEQDQNQDQDQEQQQEQGQQQGQNPEPEPEREPEQDDEQGQGQQNDKQDDKMSEEEALRWLSTLKENRRPPKGQAKKGTGRRYQVEKDW